ncbi:hypothetical protein AO242_23790 [Pseudomonas sp. ICMP 561]|nr:hypothetical protein AO242_23790 [Pseudomonas sp. ICMP 561]
MGYLFKPGWRPAQIPVGAGLARDKSAADIKSIASSFIAGKPGSHRSRLLVGPALAGRASVHSLNIYRQKYWPPG